MDFVLVILIIIIIIVPDLIIKNNYRKYSKIKNNKGLSGQEVASKILEKHGLDNIYVIETPGFLTDHYDSRRKAVRLSKLVFDGESISSLAISSFESYNVIQDKKNNLLFKIRSFIFPIFNIITNLSYYIILIGLLLQVFNHINIAIAITIVGLLFQIITLPIKLNASKNGLEELEKLKITKKDELISVKKLLIYVNYTYIAGIVASILQIIRLLLLIRS